MWSRPRRTKLVRLCETTINDDFKISKKLGKQFGSSYPLFYLGTWFAINQPVYHDMFALFHLQCLF